MAHHATMPKWGLTMKEGKLTRWLKNEGDNVQAGEALFEVETDKITNAVESPATGVLFQIVVPEGDTVPVKTVVAVIAEPGETPERFEGGAASEASAPQASAASAAKPGANSDAKAAAKVNPNAPASPAARKLARELGVDLATVAGTGPKGRITEKDVQAAADSGPAVNATQSAIDFARKKGVDLADVQGTGEDGKITKADILRAMNPNYAATSAAKPQACAPKTSAQPASPAPSSQPAAKPAAPAGPAAGSTIPMDGIRKLIADNMMASLHNAAQLTVFVEIDATEMVALRKKLLARNSRNPDYRLSYNDIISYAVCRALGRHPLLNSTLVDDTIQLHEQVNLGVAVSLDGGLIVPNVKGAEKLSLEQMAVAVRDVAGRARKGGLNMDEISGGTFTISNVSMLGVDGFTPILNPPETGILGVGRVVEKPAVHDGEICIRQMMTLSLTFDHRVADGAPAMTFLRTLADYLEDPGLMLA
ncbi:MAG: 2-oxo acid dehydrogenase subunit E2 [Desulfovibrio sp.]|uniref:2-oxo acid dehydrogenase subunit E2 n=1 Tax=Desulfovibrio sp. 7SRBS1 TaxID=3378064 RepID=UPI003B4040D9